MMATKQKSADPSILPSYITQLIGYLGEPVVLLPWPSGTKGTNRKWKHHTVDSMRDPAYLKRLANAGNIGVALGTTSCNLVSIDLDDDDAATAFLERNPALAATFRTKGNRGCNFWVRLLGQFPGTFDIKQDGRVVGEFRSNGHQTIAHGTHPKGMMYRWLVRAPAAVITFDSINWFDAPNQTPKGAIAQRDRDSDDSDESQEIEGVLSGGSESPPEPSPAMPATFYTPDMVVNECVPIEGHRNHKLLHRLQRGIRTLELQEGVTYGLEKKTAIFDLWYERAQKTGVLRRTRSQYFFEFMSSDNVKVPLGADGIATAIQRARSEPLPPEASKYADSPSIQLLIALCYQLQLVAGSNPFFLSSRKAASVLGEPQRTCASWLKALCRVGPLRLVQQGGTSEHVRDASRYLYISEQ